jgi:guanylate kinase
MSEPASAPLLLVISAPSGGGKTTVCQRLREQHPDLDRAITCTTRPPRPGEQNGVDYHFLDVDSFRRGVAQGDFLEHATVYGHLYGIWKAEVLSRLRAGRDVLLSVDVQGVASIQAAAASSPELGQALVTVFLAPPSLAVLEQRLQRRNQDPPEVIARRLNAALGEIGHWSAFHYVIVSGTVEEDARRMQAVFIAEKMKTGRVRLPVYG